VPLVFNPFTGTFDFTGTSSGGTVTSVGLSLPTEFTVSGSPVTTSGTLTAVWASELQHFVFAAPSGGNGTPSFRALVASDLPAGTGTVTSVGLSLPAELTVSGSPVTTTGTLTAVWASEGQNFIFAAPSGSAGAPAFRALTSGDLPAGTGTVTSIATTSPISGGTITTTGTISLLVNVDFLFTHSQTITPGAAGQGGLTLTGATETVSTPLLNMTQTWNAGGVTFTGLKFNVTNTASASASLLIDLQVGTVSQFKVREDGLVTTPGGGTFGSDVQTDGNLTGKQSSSNLVLGVSGTQVRLLNDGASHLLAQRSGTNAQGINLYNTFTSSTSFERLMLDWINNANVAMIYTQKGSGGGTARVLQFNYGGTTTSAISIPITSGLITLGGPLLSDSGTAIPAGGTAGVGHMFSSTSNFGVFFGSGAPTLSAAKGSLYLRSDGTGTGDRAFINTNGTTTWTAITTAA
jgi:hypothetical protein